MVIFRENGKGQSYHDEVKNQKTTYNPSGPLILECEVQEVINKLKERKKKQATANSSVGGVGILLSPKAMENLLSIEKISPRVVIADFRGNPRTTVISCYSPDNNSSDEETNQFYNTLRSTLENVPTQNFLLVTGDFNAKLGTDDAKFTFHTLTNRNGEHMVDLMEKFNLYPANTKFMKSKNQLWTFEYPNGSRAQLDFILVRKKWQNSIKDCRAYSSFSSVGSDHQIVSAKVKLSFRVSKKPTADPMTAIDWKVVYPNEEVALSTLPKKTKSRRNPDIKISEARENLKKISSMYHRHPSQSNRKKLTTAKKSLDHAYLEAKEAYINGKITEISHLHINQQHSAAWKTINELAGKSSKPPPTIKGGSREQRLGEYTIAELKCVLKKLINKVLGPDKIPAILWKDSIFHQSLLDLCRSTLGQILTLRRIIEEITFCNKTAALIFVDISKAFDSVNRETMFEILELYGIPVEIIEAIKVLYTNTQATVLTPDGETEPFDILAGILQGDTLAPFLFIIVIEYIMRISVDTIKENGLMYQPMHVHTFVWEYCYSALALVHWLAMYSAYQYVCVFSFYHYRSLSYKNVLDDV
ncbi:uncharacterized protein LOC134773922 [Penaeus indicus]|uniref:uncharacterized protein LOC134773922 n=1 Tax=Penaeus indicus TaxID=29960 RepID=UPI00300C5C9A